MSIEPKSFVNAVCLRMQTHPDEFISGSGSYKWGPLVEALERVSININTGMHDLVGVKLLWAFDKQEIEQMLSVYRVIYKEHLLRQFVKSVLGEQSIIGERTLPMTNEQVRTSAVARTLDIGKTAPYTYMKLPSDLSGSEF